ncbi:MAG: hypothetical protein KatS3mg116_2717 [Elioraea sp.]|nr:MAG: hypothetical protein KatS3mg116_2717 [Elioraea sp.]
MAAVGVRRPQGYRPTMTPLSPGMRVRNPNRPDWGAGQVQSVIGDRVTVNFEHAGKLLVNTAVVALEPIETDRDVVW